MYQFHNMYWIDEIIETITQCLIVYELKFIVVFARGVKAAIIVSDTRRGLLPAGSTTTTVPNFVICTYCLIVKFEISEGFLLIIMRYNLFDYEIILGTMIGLKL